VNVLALNAGSSTLKYRLVADPTWQANELAGGLVEHPGGPAVASAAEEVVRRCRPLGVHAAGCRVVHGGARFVQPTVVTDAVSAEIRALSHLAPLHNPLALETIEACRRLLPDVPVVAVFDTAFHATLPEVAYRYALPCDLADRDGLRRYGFHGISHRHVAADLLARLGRPAEGTRVIICHLGNGASLCAVRDGQSIDTSMGLTPLEGLVMGTRSGDVDPGLLLHLLRQGDWTADRLDHLLNHESGLLGLSGQSGDVRQLEEAAQGDARARLALDIFAYRARKYLGAYAAALGGLDAVAFTAGIGEHAPLVRQRICEGLDFLGICLDPGRNEQARGQGPARISTDEGAVAVWVLPTDEEREIARQTAGLVEKEN
jgi:acetate kinase